MKIVNIVAFTQLFIISCTPNPVTLPTQVVIRCSSDAPAVTCEKFAEVTCTKYKELSVSEDKVNKTKTYILECQDGNK